MDYIKEIESLVEIFRDLGLDARYYYLWYDKRHVVSIENRDKLTLTYKNPKELLENLIGCTSGVKYYVCKNDWRNSPEVIFEFPVYSSANELRMKLELLGKMKRESNNS